MAKGPRPTWQGHLRLSLVSCPVALYTATSRTTDFAGLSVLRPWNDACRTCNGLGHQMRDPHRSLGARASIPPSIRASGGRPEPGRSGATAHTGKLNADTPERPRPRVAARSCRGGAVARTLLHAPHPNAENPRPEMYRGLAELCQQRDSVSRMPVPQRAVPE